MADDQGPAGATGRPLPASWWVPGGVFASSYTAAVAAAGLTAAELYAHRPRGQLLELFLPGPCFLIIGLVPFLYCHLMPVLSGTWFDRVVERRTPFWTLVVSGATCGSVVGVALFGLAFVPDRTLQQVGLIPLITGTPLVGIWWLIARPMRPRDHADYDDDMTPDPHPSGGPVTIDLPDLAATEEFGRRLGGLLFPNAVVALFGPLGAGKTHLSRAIAEGLGIANPAAVTSPTFTLIHEYPARLAVYHFDAYRLNGLGEFLDLGVTEYYEAGGVCLIEWADKVEAALPDERLTIRLVAVDETRRRAELTGVGERYERLVRELASGAA